jgi:mannose-6-phosphate isomerase-like protein (cupin superfamily)
MIKFVPKRWGYEKWIANNDMYCGKILFIASGQTFSYHYHKIKHETFHVLSGRGRMIVTGDIDCQYPISLDIPTHYVNLSCGITVTVLPNQPHKVWADEDLTIMEVSTHHDDSDSYRLERIEDNNAR